MEKRTEGAWLIHHTKKLQIFENTQDFEDIELAGKCGIFLSNLAASNEQSDLNADKVAAIAKVSNIKKTEIDTIKRFLKDARLIETSSNGALSVLGVTTSSVLSHTSNIFEKTTPSNFQKASIELAENISDLPKDEKTLKEYISDNHKLASSEVADLFNQCEEIGLVDYEKIDNNSKCYFNGNLFRKENLQKTSAVLSSLKQEEIAKINTLDSFLREKGCLSLENVKKLLGDKLLSKLQSIGMYDFNEVSNDQEAKVFITKPGAFSKYGNPFEEDALDLAKAFVSSLYYGMNYSVSSRGKITMLQALMRKLINGHPVGPATAIGQDYKLLELRRVVKLSPAGNGMYYMRLLKRDIGEIALQVLQFGDAVEQTVINPTLYSGNIIRYVGPEEKRSSYRKKQNSQSKNSVVDLLRTFRS